MRTIRVTLVAAILAVLLAPSGASARSAPDAGKAFIPKPWSKLLYGSKPPEDDPETQRHYVEGHDGTDLYVETYLPAPLGDEVPPAKVPTILIMTPYATLYTALGADPFIEYMNARGYAVAYHHVRGTGNSGGCLEQTSRDQIKDGARVVEYLGRDAPWSNGKVGMYGASYDAETQISTAAFGEPDRIRYLKAIIPTATVGSQYDWNYMDGVPWTGQPAIGNSNYLAISALPEQQPNPQYYPERVQCQDEVMTESANQTGDYTDYWKIREYRPGAPDVKAATLMVHGLRDFNVQPITLAGFFDRLPRSTPHKGLFGVWEHAFPDSHSVEPDWARADWMDMVVAWFDRYLKGKDTDVEEWPNVQVQTSRGQWWAVNEFPTTGGRLGQLALGPAGILGTKKPDGESVFTEQTAPGPPEEGQAVVFETPKLKAPLHVTGQPMLDLWFTADKEDAHIGAKLEVIGRDGEPLQHDGREAKATYGVRSMQHIEPMPRGWFEQETSKPLTPFEATRATIRFLPTDLMIPRGASLRLTVGGSVSYSKGDSLPSGAGAQVTILHSCQRPSVLRFRMPDKTARLLNVREIDEIGQPLKSTPAKEARRDGAGLASAAVCGRAPKALPFL